MARTLCDIYFMLSLNHGQCSLASEVAAFQKIAVAKIIIHLMTIIIICGTVR